MSDKEQTALEIMSSSRVFSNGSCLLFFILFLIVYLVECNGCGIINQLGVGR